MLRFYHGLRIMTRPTPGYGSRLLWVCLSWVVPAEALGLVFVVGVAGDGVNVVAREGGQVGTVFLFGCGVDVT